MSDKMIGREIGRYKILELIGEGGMATVYKAFDPRLEREVAIKVIRREVFSPAEMEMLLKRFEREAKSLGRLSHPNIVPVIDYGEFEGAPYLVMIYVSGGTLKERLGAPIPWRNAVQTLLPIAHALQYVHDQNIINRDIKPSNILMTENGEPLLTDFGLVKVYGEKREATLITGSGAGLGTPDYMAPEQWIGKTTAKSDMYSLGVVLYEMITGRRPYKADTPAGVLLKQANEPLPLPTDYIPGLPRDVESVLLKVLAKDPENRYPDIHAFVSELKKLLSGEKVTASSIKVERLRAQMTGTVEIQPTPTPTPIPPAPDVTPTPQPSYAPPTPAFAPTPTTPRKRNLALPAVLIMLFGGIILIAAIGGCWFLYNNPDIFYISFGPTPVPVSQVAASPTTRPPSPTAIAPTETKAVAVASATSAPPTEATLPEEIKDDEGVTMRLVPAGEFSMGSDNSVDVVSRPAHTVTLEAFYIDKFEVTNAMYAKCDAPECRDPRNPGSLTRSVYYRNPNFANYPVIYVDWWMASAYCTWRGARLPSEAEWEKAARGTDGRVYPWASQERNCFYSNLAGCEEDTSAVDKFEQGQSIYGIYDLSGNVWEWTNSLFKPYPYDPDDGRESLTAQGKRVLRGGSFHIFGVQSGTARNDTRFEMDPTYYGAYVGFRCAIDAETE
jgi:serine/threonine protein kinase/formylglycine-generating enzyme required for sulfatase activity